MRTFDDEVLEAGLDFIERKHKEGQPFFLWMNSTRMHYPTYVPKQWEGASGKGLYADGVLQHDAWVGSILQLLDSLGVAENTIVVYNADNGPQNGLWPDGGITPYRSEKFTNWEGAYRVPGFSSLARAPSTVEAFPTKSCLISTGSRRCWRLQGTRISKTNWLRAARWAKRGTVFIWTGTTSYRY